MHFGHLVAGDENACDGAHFVADRLIDEVDILGLFAALQADFHAAGDKALAGGENLVEQFKIPLVNQLR